MLPSHLHEQSNGLGIGAERMLRYLNRKSRYEKKLKPEEGTQITVDVDASRGNDVERGRRSQSGMMLMYGNAVVAATTNIQKLVRQRYTVAEYVASSEAAKTIVLLQKVCSELGFEQGPARVHQVSEVCIELANGRANKYFKTARVHIYKAQLYYLLGRTSCHCTAIYANSRHEDRLPNKLFASQQLSSAISASKTFTQWNSVN